MARRDVDEMERISEQLGDLVGNLWRWNIGGFCPAESWAPPVNVYRFERRLEVCVELGGIDPKTVDVHVEPGRLRVRGNRAVPEPPHHPGESMRILSMEIDHGPFCCIVPLPQQVDIARVSSNFDDGLLWIHLPLRVQG